MERAGLTRLLQATGCAQERGGRVYLVDRNWTPTQLADVRALQESAVPAGADATGWICVPTGGSSGVVRFAQHDEATLLAAAEGFRRHFGLERVNAVDVLPAFHVSGLLARVRCAASGGTHRSWDWHRLAAGDRPSIGSGDWVISLVPTQLQRLLGSPEAVAWLRGFRIILLGGGPAWAEVTEGAAAARLPVSLSYGMTETAAMVTALDPAEFLAGARDSGPPLPHAAIGIDADGTIVVEAASVFRGYLPETRATRRFATDDAGALDARGHLHVFGRRDALIITGGEKVQPAEVEALLRATGEFADVAVIGVPDPRWGEAVVACHPRGARPPDLLRVRAALEAALSPHKRPKQYVPIDDWPRTEHGKLNRARLRDAALAARPGSRPGR